MNLSGPTWDRTRDLPVMSRWLYQLSYGPIRENSPIEISVSSPYFQIPGTRNEHSTPLEGIKVMGREGKKGLRDWLRIHRLGKGRVK